MTRLLTLGITAALAIALAQSQPAAAKAQQAAAASKPDSKVAAVKRHPDGRPLGVPFNATKISDAAWRTVENGTPVVYRSTAFGFTKLTEAENAKIQRMIDGKPDEKAEAPAGMSVVEKDGKLYFKRITPFGPYEWVKEKTNLNAAEKAVWEMSQAGSPKGASKQ